MSDVGIDHIVSGNSRAGHAYYFYRGVRGGAAPWGVPCDFTRAITTCARLELVPETENSTVHFTTAGKSEVVIGEGHAAWPAKTASARA